MATSTPRRRSSRLRQSPASARRATADASSPLKLATLVERQDTPEHAHDPSLNSIASPEASTELNKTPTAAGHLKPSIDEMHPSHFHSTAKKMASEVRFGFTGASKAQTPTKSASGEVAPPSSSPTKPCDANTFASPNFEFRFTRPSSELSSEAQRLMDEVREQAAKIKTELAAQRDEQLRKDGEANTLFGIGGRKIAKPRGRFSDIHKDQFKKMDSIANHASAYRADPARLPTPKQSLKRSNSKAELDTPQVTPKKVAGTVHSVRTPENDQGPSKRRKNFAGQQTARFRPETGAAASSSKIGTPTFDSPKASRLPGPSNGLVTPTKPSLPRPMSAHSLKTHAPATPSLLRTVSTKSIATEPRPGQHRSAFANKLSSGVKSILRRPQIRFSNDPAKVAAGTHVATPTKQDLNKALPNVPGGDVTPSNRKEKHVNFSPSPTYFEHGSPAPPPTPSPVKVAAEPVSIDAIVRSPTLPDALPTNSAEEESSPTKASRRSTAVPGDFTFRADSTISFSQSPKPKSTPTIRTVRASEAAVIGTGPGKKTTDLPSVPHGLSNKKRKRDSDALDGAEENKENETKESKQPEDSPTKRRKTQTISTPTKVRMPPSVRKPEGSTKKKGFLSLSRLQELAKPKHRI